MEVIKCPPLQKVFFTQRIQRHAFRNASRDHDKASPRKQLSSFLPQLGILTQEMTKLETRSAITLAYLHFVHEKDKLTAKEAKSQASQFAISI